jgi:hypothetical protein
LRFSLQYLQYRESRFITDTFALIGNYGLLLNGTF